MATEQTQIDANGLLSEAVHRLVELFQPERIYLFGSRGRGDARGDSDYDLMVVVPHSDQSSYEREVDAYRVLWGVRIPIDVLVWTSEEFHTQLPVIASLPAAIVREGELLYAA